MGEPAADLRKYLAPLARAAPEAVEALALGLSVPRRAAADAFAAAGALVLAGLSRHARRRSPAEALTVLRKYARPGDLGAPDLAIGAHLSRADLNPRLGGLLGDDASGVCSWLSERSGADGGRLGRALAAAAPLALGALAEALSPVEVERLLARVGDGCLADARLLLDPASAGGRVFRRLRRAGIPWLARVLAPS